jgi:methylated-DNA-[protein]-cysteine S-methyltransferase
VISRICGANPNIPSTPCHRVVRSDGKVDGYAHGTDRKIELLTQEGISINEKHTIKHMSEYLYHEYFFSHTKECR